LSPPSPTRTSKVVPAETDPTTAAAAIAVVKRMMIESLKVEGEVVEEDGAEWSEVVSMQAEQASDEWS
jgi:hypothetical protein